MNVAILSPVDDEKRWMLHEGAWEILNIVRFHARMGTQYHEAGCDFLAVYHAGELRRCVMAYLKTVRELSDLTTPVPVEAPSEALASPIEDPSGTVAQTLPQTVPEPGGD